MVLSQNLEVEAEAVVGHQRAGDSGPFRAWTDGFTCSAQSYETPTLTEEIAGAERLQIERQRASSAIPVWVVVLKSCSSRMSSLSAKTADSLESRTV